MAFLRTGVPAFRMWLPGAVALATAPAPALARVADAAAAVPAARGIAEAFFIQRHPETGDVEWLGSLIVWLLMLLSAGSLGLLGARWLENRRERVIPERLFDGGADPPAGDPDDPAAGERLVAGVLAERDRGRGAMLRAAEQLAEEFVLSRLRGIEPLAVVGNVAPMIGLFGTVYGMILAFGEIVASGGTPDPVGLAAGIGTALTTTFWGLVVAIPALAGHALLRNRIEGLGLELARRTEELAGRVADEAPARPAGAPTPARPARQPMKTSARSKA